MYVLNNQAYFWGKFPRPRFTDIDVYLQIAILGWNKIIKFMLPNYYKEIKVLWKNEKYHGDKCNVLVSFDQIK